MTKINECEKITKHLFQPTLCGQAEIDANRYSSPKKRKKNREKSNNKE